MRAALMTALADVPELDAEFVTDRILPTVRQIVAHELREAADDVDDGEHSNLWSHAARQSILSRAAALDPTS